MLWACGLFYTLCAQGAENRAQSKLDTMVLAAILDQAFGERRRLSMILGHYFTKMAKKLPKAKQASKDQRTLSESCCIVSIKPTEASAISENITRWAANRCFCKKIIEF
jgi:hypothetical protein